MRKLETPMFFVRPGGGICELQVNSWGARPRRGCGIRGKRDTLVAQFFQLCPRFFDLGVKGRVNQIQIIVLDAHFSETRFERALRVFDITQDFCGDEELVAWEGDFFQCDA